MEMKKIEQQILHGERALFKSENLHIVDSIFEDGESPLKESSNIEVEKCIFKWMYPLWYCKDVKVKNSTWDETARAGVWYNNNISLEDCVINAPKNFRRCSGINMKNIFMPNGAEALWYCRDVELENVNAKGDYFAMNSENMRLDNFTLIGKYSFDGVKNVEIRNSHLATKDAFWNSENVTVYDSFISSEYLGWNSKNLTLINCTVESLQGMCYIENLVMENCRLLNTNLAFEYSTVDVDIKSRIESVKNPSGGIIRAESIGEIIMEEDKVDPSKTKIVCSSDEDIMAKAI